MSEIITIDLASEKSIAAAIAAGITTPELLAEIIDGAEVVGEGELAVLILEPGIWHANDGQAEVTGEFDSGEEAAQDYVDGGDWGNEDKTQWIDVTVWREGIDTDGDVAKVDEESHTITIEPEEPDCTEAQHDWQSPYEILGGCKENPGVWGSGGGVLIHEVCMHCGCERVTDTWAQNPSNGVQGLRSVEYHEGKYADEIHADADGEEGEE